MQNPYIHNSLFRPSRLIYLADNSGKSPNPEGGKNEDDSPLTDYQKHMAHTLSSGVHKLSEEDFQGSHKLDPAILEDLFNSKNSKLKDGSYDKTDKNDPYNLFMQALKNGMFPKRGKNAERFLRALDGGNNEEKAAIKILKDNGRGPISENKFDKLLNKLEEATQEDAQQELEKAMAEFGEQVSSPTQSVDITELLKQTAEFEDKPELTLEPMKFGAFEIAPPDPELVKKYNEMVSEFNEKSHEFAQEVIKQIRAGEEFFGDVSGKSDQEIEQMKKTLQSTTNGLLVELNRTQKLKKKLEPVKQQALDYYYRNIARYQDLRIFGKLTGIDLLRLTKLKIWDLKTSKDGTSLEMGGLKVKKTGATEKAWGEIEIVKIHFRNDQNDEGDSPGALVIEYRENNSKETVETSMSNFIGLLNGLEAHEEIDDLESLNLIIKEETGDKNLEQGDSFKAEKLVDIDEDGNGIYETEEFKIEAIDPESKKIKLDKVIIKIPQRDLQLSISNQLYFDHAQQEYSYGEFARMLKYRGFHRSDQADEQTIRRVQNPAYPEQGPRPQVPTERPDQFDIDEALEEMGVVPPEDQENPPTQTSPPTVPEIAQGQTPEPPLAETAQGQTPEPPLAATASTSTSTQEKPSKPELGEPKKIKAKYNKEALPYDDVFKVGNMDIKGRNYAKELWGSTTFLCVDDVWELAKACWEFYQRRWQRKQKARYSGAFKDSPIIDKEMKRINQAAENEEMGQYKESLDQMGVREVQERLRVTKDQDELKACYSVLSASGQMNWDDIEMWKNLNNFVDSSLSIPIPRNGDPRTRISKDSERTGKDFLQGAIDSLWGESTYSGWYSENKSNCASKAQGFYEEGNELEGIQGGHARRLGELLRRHKEGEWVDPHEYEGLILHAIEYGKSSLSNKFYYMIEGVGAVNDRGETILTLDRLAHINSKHLTRFPLLEYVNAEVARGPNGEKRHRFTKDDYEHWCNIFDEGDPKNSKITKSVDDFLWEYVLPSNDTQNRINKVLRSAENLDHDDMYGYMPPATEGIVEELCKSTTGSKKFLTAEGYMNGLPGFSEYLRRTAQNDQKNKLREGIKSYIRFQGIITDDYKKGNESFFRTDRSMLNRASICSPTHSIVFLEQTTEVIKKVVDHYVNTYNNDELRDVADKIFNWKSGNMKLHEKEREKQYTIDEAYKKFGEVFDNAVQKDKGQAMKKIVEESNLLGMPTLVSDEEMQKRKKEAENSGKAGAIGDLDD